MAPKAQALILAVFAAGCASAPPGTDPERAKILREKGDEAYQRKDFAAAVEFYTRAIEENPDHPELYYWRANAYPALNGGLRAQDAMNLALADYDRAIAKNVHYYDAYWNRAVVSAYFKRYKEAAQDFIQCAQLRKNDPEPHLWIGELYETKFEDRGLRAMEHYETYARLGGTDATVIEKVRAWQQLKAQIQPAPPKGPTAEEEARAKELHDRLVGLIAQGKSDEAFTVLDDLLSKFSHTKYVRDRLTAFNAMHRALKPPEKK